MPDAYTARARLAPAGLLLVPGLAFVGALGFSPTLLGALTSATVGALGLVAAGLIRDRGRAIQDALWAGWGGSPTTQGMRWARNDPVSVKQRHEDIAALTEIAMPGPDAEAADAAAADQVYERAGDRVRTLIRETDDHRILNDANAEYGFRRNCLGVRSFALALSLVSTGAAVAFWAVGAGTQPRSYLAAAAVAGVLAAFWALVVTPRWVRTAADRYAQHFFETVAKVRQAK